MPAFRCIHCGSRSVPKRYIDTDGSSTKTAAGCGFLLTLLTCGLGLIVAVPLYFLMADRKTRCRDCGIVLG